MKKLVCLVICICLIISTLSISAFAAPTSKTPIVFIPGTIGSFEVKTLDAIVNWYDKVNFWDEPWQPRDFFKSAQQNAIKQKSTKMNSDGKFYVSFADSTYDLLYSTLIGLGYKKETDLFLFGYDTIETSIPSNANNLQTYINYVLDKTKAKKVNIIAHSQGNLVARQYIENNSGFTKVNKLIMLSPPNQGVAKSLGAYFMGETKAPRTWFGSEIDLELIKWMTFYRTGSVGSIPKPVMEKSDRISWIQNRALALNGMIPTTYSTKNGKQKTIYINNFLDNLNSKSGINNLLKIGVSNIIAFYGTNNRTIEGYSFTDLSYQNGYPNFANDGDDTVTIGSLTFLNQYGIKSVPRKSVNHGGICSDAQVLNEIKSTLQNK